MKRERVELLSPAGDLERLKIAVMYGADAVYIGGKQFSLRSRASNFGLTEIAEGVRFAKQYGARIHVTVNMLPHEADLEGLKTYLRELERIGVTAVIVGFRSHHADCQRSGAAFGSACFHPALYHQFIGDRLLGKEGHGSGGAGKRVQP